jgi:hypothetical protein
MPNYEELGSNAMWKSASAFYASRVSMRPSEGNDQLIDVFKDRFAVSAGSVSRVPSRCCP